MPVNVEVKEELSDCTRCGAGRGFHVSFRRMERRLAVILVCPSCGFRFTVGEWTFPTGEQCPIDPVFDLMP